MKTPNLFDVPKDSPTRKERIEAFKIANDIETHYSDALPEWPWIAVKMDLARDVREPYRTCDDNSMGAVMADVCRLLDEAGICADGKTEASAIQKLCANLELVCTI